MTFQAPKYTPQQKIGRYTVTRTAYIADTDTHLTELRHELGSHHIHIERDDDNSGFSVTFPTVPADSSGVAHILEHLALMGSKNYPVSDPFFGMIPRSLNTFMNAMTSSDWTTYLFSTRNHKDFENLLGVYLDAAFFPLLTKQSFLRDGWRLEYSDPADSSSELKLQGVVYNEMKGAMSSAGSVLWRSLGKALYPDLTYANNSGGAPEHIPELTYDNLKAFHAAHYHPSNAYFYTYGKEPLPWLLEQIESKVLSHFAPHALDVHIPDQASFDAPRRETVPYPSGDLERGAQTLVAWKVGKSYDAYDNLKWSLLSEILLGNPAAPLYKPLIDSGLGAGLADGSGYLDNFREGAFAAGLKGLSVDKAAQVEELVLHTLQNIVDTGLEKELIDSALHQFALAQREVSNAGTPYALKVMFAVLRPWLYGGDPVAALELGAELERLQAELAAGQVFEPMIKEWLLDNAHRVTLTLKPDPQMAERQLDEEKALVSRLGAALTEDDKARIVREALELQNPHQDDPNALPTLELGDLDTSTPTPPYTLSEVLQGGQLQASVYRAPAATGGLVYLDVQLALTELSQDELELLPFYAYAVTRNGAGTLDEVALTRAIDAYTGGIGAAAGSQVRAEDSAPLTLTLSFGGKALSRNAPKLVELLALVMGQPHFTESRLAQLVAQRVAAFRSGLVGNGSAYAAGLAGAQVSPQEALGEMQGGFTAFARMQGWLEGKNWAGLKARLEALHAKLLAGQGVVVLTANEEDLSLDLSPITALLGTQAGQAITPALRPRVPQARTTDTPVAYNAAAYATVPYTHVDSPALLVLSKLLRTEYLLRELREKGGAYGGGASFSPRSGVFTLSSYRDPHIERTYGVFGKVAEFLNSSEVDSRMLKEAIISAQRQLDPLPSASSQARESIFAERQGFGAAVQEDYKTRLMKVTLDDLRRVQQSYLTPNKAAYALLAGRDPNSETAALGLSFEVQGV